MRVPTTREEIRAALADRGLRPLHRLGQNFLVRPSLLKRTVEHARVAAGDLVVEVGPGLGGLTACLLEAGARVVAMELDGGLADLLQENLAGEERFTLLRGDVMERKSRLAPSLLEAVRAVGRGEPWKVVSNLPYQISSPFLSALVALDDPPASATVLLQQEVGEVLEAVPGSGAYSPLSFLARLYLDVRRLESVPPSAFHPRPKVDSALLHLVFLEPGPIPPGRVLPFARRLFQGRRKALGGTVPRALSETVGGAWEPKDVRDLMATVGLAAKDRIDAVDPGAIRALVVLAEGRLRGA